MNTKANISPIEPPAIGNLWWTTLLAALASAVGNIGVLVLGQNLLGISFLMPTRPGSSELVPLELGRVIVFSVVPAIVATGLFVLLSKFTKRPFRLFGLIAIVFLLVSFILDLILPVDGETKIGLMVMHVVSAAAIMGSLMKAVRVK